MVRAQIQLPDELYVRAKKLCRSREISMAELARRGIEYMLSTYPDGIDKKCNWTPPEPESLGWTGLSDPAVKHEARLTTSEISAPKTERR